MTRYSKYKNFIPLDFIDKKRVGEQKSNRLGIYTLVILNFVMLPINIENLFYNVEVVEPKSYAEEANYNYSDIYKWFTLNDISVESITVYDDVGEVILSDSNYLKDIDENGFLVKKVRIEDNNVIVTLRGDRTYEEKKQLY